ncbi:MAG TPA: hypothetical protein VL069_15965, partial [Opitutus sp.]|nr:hypothetical protein [Opitutus sp.]
MSLSALRNYVRQISPDDDDEDEQYPSPTMEPRKGGALAALRDLTAGTAIDSDDDRADEPGTFRGTLNSLKRGAAKAGQSVDAATLGLAAANAADADKEPERVAFERREDAPPVRSHFDRYGDDGDRVYTISLQKWQMREAQREERLINNARFAEGIRTQSEPALASAIGRREEEIAALPQTRGKREFDEAEGLGGALKAVARHPIDSVAGIVAESLPASAPSLALGALGSAAGPGGTMLGAGAGSFMAEYGNKIQEELQAAGVDFQKPETIAKILNDPEQMEAIRTKAVKRGIPVALFDAVSAGIAGRLMRAPGKTLAKKISHTAAEVGIQG